MKPFKLGPRFAYLAKVEGAILPGRKRGTAKKADRDWRYYGRKLTVVFNRWIRYRDTRPTDDGGRVGICITWRKPVSFEKLQACHFIPAPSLGTRWHEKNVNAGCAHCNKWLEGNRIEYVKWIVKRWGKGVIDELAIAKKLFARRPEVETLKAQIADYTHRLKEFR